MGMLFFPELPCACFILRSLRGLEQLNNAENYSGQRDKFAPKLTLNGCF